MIKTTRPKVADLLALKGRRQLTQVLVRSIDEAAAACSPNAGPARKRKDLP